MPCTVLPTRTRRQHRTECLILGLRDPSPPRARKQPLHRMPCASVYMPTRTRRHVPLLRQGQGTPEGPFPCAVAPLDTALVAEPLVGGHGVRAHQPPPPPLHVSMCQGWVPGCCCVPMTCVPSQGHTHSHPHLSLLRPWKQPLGDPCLGGYLQCLPVCLTQGEPTVGPLCCVRRCLRARVGNTPQSALYWGSVTPPLRVRVGNLSVWLPASARA